MKKEFDSKLDFAAREKDIIDFWNSRNIFKKSIDARTGGKEFSFYDGPPTANGKPHIGHILTRVMKDIIPRYQTMKGRHVLRKAGWDTHGLPVELEVEKSLGFDGKDDIEKFGVEPFVKACKQSVFKYTKEWEVMSERVGYWVDMKNPYITYSDDFIESVWWAIKEIFNKGLIYKGHKIVPYCPRCGTALSSHEVAQGYKDVEDISAVAKFRLKSDADTSILAWTTTPWTLPSNVALCVNPNVEYSTVLKLDTSEKFILASALIAKHFEEGSYKVIETKQGKLLTGLEYLPLFNTKAFDEKGAYKNCYIVTADNFVTTTDGTGVVHIAPAYGEDDSNVGKKNNLPFVQMVHADGKFDNRFSEFANGELVGVFCKDADKLILKDLKIRGLLFSKAQYKHSYPFCWRCHKPLIYYARASWFIAMTKVKKQLVKNNNSVNWIPDSIKSGRMGNFLENVIDWGISRERYWGTPLPLWICKDCGSIEAIGSKKELKLKGGVKGDIELHKPYVDGVVLKCNCGGKMHRTPEVMDCWFDSGAMPFAQLNYPFKNQDVFNKTFPADFISEAVDQTRGWFYTLLAISTLLFNKSPFKNCIVLGHVNDKDGKKMSKHIGNVVDPMPVLDTHGADALRWYFYVSSNPWLPSRFYADAVGEAGRKFLGTLWNVCGFYSLYAKIDKFDPSKYKLNKSSLSLLDKWVLSELNALIVDVDANLKVYKITESARKIEEFVDSLSNWYIRRSRDRFWGKGMVGDKLAAFMTLFTVLERLSKLIAPFVPFISESIHAHFVKPFIATAKESVHLENFPKANKKLIDNDLSAQMNTVLQAANLGRSARSGANLKLRQPLAKLYLAGKTVSLELQDVLADELNVKAIEFIESSGDFVDYKVKPQLKTLGPKYGKLLGGIRAHLEESGTKIVNATQNGGEYSFSIAGEKVSLTSEDILTEAVSKEGFASESSGGIAVILDTKLNEELISEGYVRELVSKIQSMRKDASFEVTDKIKIAYSGDDYIKKIFTTYKGTISTAVLAKDIEALEIKADVIDINGKAVKILIEKVGK